MAEHKFPMQDLVEIPEDYICPITQELMEDPVVAADGQSYERKAIEEWLTRHPTSPMTNARLAHRSVIPNVRLKSIIDEFRQKLPAIQREQQIRADLMLAIQLREEALQQQAAKHPIHVQPQEQDKDELQRALLLEKQRNDLLQQQLQAMQQQIQQLQLSASQVSASSAASALPNSRPNDLVLSGSNNFFAQPSTTPVKAEQQEALNYPSLPAHGKVLQVVAGTSHSFILTDAGLFACGVNGAGQLGLGHTKGLGHTNSCHSFTAVPVSGKVLQVAVGGWHSFILTDAGLFACGANGAGQLGLGHTNSCHSFTAVPVRGKVLQVAAGAGHSFILTDAGLFVCGYNGYGQLGLGHTRNCDSFTAVPVPGKVLQVAAGENHSFILTDAGLFACGHNNWGHLGLGHTKGQGSIDLRHSFTAVPVRGKVLQVAAGFSHNIILTDAGLFACGYNTCGQLGLGHTNSCHSFTAVPVRGKVLQVAAGARHSFILTDAGLFACGYNSYGQLGLGHTNSCDSFTAVPVRSKVLQVAAKLHQSFILTDAGLFACGSSQYGQLGLGHTNDCDSFTAIPNLPERAADQSNSRSGLGL